VHADCASINWAVTRTCWSCLRTLPSST
jgi:hypothetical protein